MCRRAFNLPTLKKGKMNPIHFIAVSIFFLLAGMGSVTHGTDAASVFTSHPLYRTYRFTAKEARVLDLGTQPLAAPSGVVGAAIGHDRLLRNALSELGWDFSSHSFLKGLDANFFFQRGDVDIVLVGDLPTITLAAQMDFRVIGLAKQGFSTLLSRGLRRIEDLRGKRVGVPPGSTAQYALTAALDSVGMSESSIFSVPLEINEIGDALAAGKVDAVVSWEPTTSCILKSQSGTTVMQRFLNNDYIYISAELEKNSPEVADLVVAAYVRALRWLREDSSNLLRAIAWALVDAERMTGKPTGLAADVIARISNNDLLKIAYSPMVPASDLEENGSLRRLFTFLQKQGRIAAAVPWSRVSENFDQSLTAKVLADPARYQTFLFDYDE